MFGRLETAGSAWAVLLFTWRTLSVSCRFRAVLNGAVQEAVFGGGTAHRVRWGPRRHLRHQQTDHWLTTVFALGLDASRVAAGDDRRLGGQVCLWVEGVGIAAGEGVTGLGRLDTLHLNTVAGGARAASRGAHSSNAAQFGSSGGAQAQRWRAPSREINQWFKQLPGSTGFWF